MISAKYKDKPYLDKYDLDVNLFEKFDLKVRDVIPVRKVFILRTDKGDKILKKIDYSVEELEFINESLNYVRSNFKRLMNFNKSIDDKIYVVWKNSIYCVIDLIEGRECEFSNPVDVEIMAKGLGEYHKASEGYNYSRHKFRYYGNAVEAFTRNLEELKFFKKLANLYENKSEFDSIFLNEVDYYISQIEESIELLKNSSYYKLCSEEDKIVLCHHDLAYHNILIFNNEAYFIDFDYAIIDLKMHDLCNLINKVMKTCAFDIEKGEKILKDYNSINTIDNREREVLYCMLYFPNDFFTISKDYYTKRKGWSEEEFLFKLNKKIGYREEREMFLEEFKKLLD